MLGEPNHVELEFVGQPCLAQGFVDHDPVALGGAAARKQKIAEFHAARSHSLRITRTTAIACQAGVETA